MMNDRVIRAARGEATDRTPVWMMRQAGRYLKEYRDIRSRVSFIDLCRNPDLAVEVSLQPYHLLGVDAVIVFSDILIPVAAMGIEVALTDRGPEIRDPVRSLEAVERLSIPDPALEMPFVGETIRRLRKELDDRVPLIGFAGAPWTLASYLVEGGTSRNFSAIKGMAFLEPGLLHRMLAKLSETIAAHLRFQIESGAQLIQLFDTWAGELAPSDYEEFALPYTRDILESLGDHVPRILYVNGCSTLVESMARSGADVLSVDWRVSLKDVRKRIGHRLGLQGNLDPGLLLGHTDRMLAQTRRILEEAGPRGHILNLGHGVLPATPVGHARALVDLVKTYRHAG